jgi:hypothetical protein
METKDFNDKLNSLNSLNRAALLPEEEKKKVGNGQAVLN